MNSRIKNAKRNILFGLLKQLAGILLPFFTRTAVIYILGATYQGLSGLFSSLLQMLNLADLGFATATVFVLYKPVADNDTKAICAILNYLKKAYRKVGIIMLSVGLLLMPFLKLFIKGEYPGDINIYVVFFIYLLNSSLSYLAFGYKNTLFIAMQREDVVSNVQLITTVLLNASQILVLVLTKNYYCFLSVLLLSTVLSNVCIQIISRHMYYEIQPEGEVSPELSLTLSKQVRALFLGKLSDVSRSSFDTLILSSLLGLTMVTVFGNYYYIFTGVRTTIMVITTAIQAGVGNSIVTESVDKNYHDYMKVTFAFMWVVSICTNCLICLYQPFMLLWMNGNTDMLLSTKDVLLFGLYFFVLNMNNTKNTYLNANGLFYKCRVWYVAEGVSNILLNIVLGYFFGVSGIIIASIVSIVLFNFIVRVEILFKNYFVTGKPGFYQLIVKNFLVTLGASFVCYVMTGKISVLTGIWSILLKLIVCVLLTIIILLAVYWKDPLFIETKSYIKKIIKRNHVSGIRKTDHTA